MIGIILVFACIITVALAAQFHVAVLVQDPGGPWTNTQKILSPNVTWSLPQLTTQLLIVRGQQLWRDEVNNMGGFIVGANTTMTISLTYLSIGYHNETKSSKLIADGKSVMYALVAGNITTTLPHLIIFVSSGNNALVVGEALFEVCESTQQCAILHNLLNNDGFYICGAGNVPLPLQCTRGNKRAGQRRWSYGLSALPAGNQLLDGWLTLGTNKGASTMVMIAEQIAAFQFNTKSTLDSARRVGIEPKMILWTAVQDTILPGPTLANVTELIRNASSYQPDLVAVLGGTGTGVLFCQHVIKALQSLDYMPSGSIVLGGGCTGSIYNDPDLKASDALRYTMGVVPFDPRVRGQFYRATDIYASREPFSATPTEDSPQVFWRLYQSRFGAANLATSTGPALGALAVAMGQKALEAAAHENPTFIDVLAGASKMSFTSHYGNVVMDVWGRLADKAHLVYQQGSNGEQTLLAPIEGGSEPIWPIPSWKDRLYYPGFYQDKSEVAVLVCTSLCLLYLMALGTLVVYYHNHAVIRAATPAFCLLIILGAAILLCTNYVWTLFENDATCIVKIWLMQVGFTLMFGSMFLKTARLWFIFDIRKLQIFRMTTCELGIGLSIMVLVECLLTAVWNGVNPVLATIVVTDVYRPIHNYTTCDINPTSWSFIYAAIAIKFFLMALTIWVAYRTRKLPSDFNESFYLAAAVWSVLFLMLIGVSVVTTSTNRVFTFYVHSFGIMILTVSTPSILFIPKLIVIWFDGSVVKYGDTWFNNQQQGHLGMTAIKNGTRIEPVSHATSKGAVHSGQQNPQPETKSSDSLIRQISGLEHQIASLTIRLEKYEPTIPGSVIIPRPVSALVGVARSHSLNPQITVDPPTLAL